MPNHSSFRLKRGEGDVFVLPPIFEQRDMAFFFGPNPLFRHLKFVCQCNEEIHVWISARRKFAFVNDPSSRLHIQTDFNMTLYHMYFACAFQKSFLTNRDTDSTLGLGSGSWFKMLECTISVQAKVHWTMERMPLPSSPLYLLDVTRIEGQCNSRHTYVDGCMQYIRWAYKRFGSRIAFTYMFSFHHRLVVLPSPPIPYTLTQMQHTPRCPVTPFIWCALRTCDTCG